MATDVSILLMILFVVFIKSTIIKFFVNHQAISVFLHILMVVFQSQIMSHDQRIPVVHASYITTTEDAMLKGY